MTKKLLLVVTAVSLLMVPMALSQVPIVGLGPTNTGAFQFTGTGSTDGGSDWSLSIVNPCPNSNFCTATGAGPAGGTNGFYSLNTAGVTITGTYEGGGSWDITQNQGIGFDIGSSVGGHNLLSGDLTLVSLFQNGKQGNFNDNLVVNLTNLAGTLAQYFPSGAILSFTLDITKGNLETLGNGVTIKATGSSGEIDNTPEPGTFAMLGAGLLTVGGYLRRKMAGV